MNPRCGTVAAMRPYKQYCALAKGLDVIGERWSLLIVRELLIREACRYTDLRAGLPGIATNLLADRLRDLEKAGVIRREEAPPPVATTLIRLTPRGLALEPVIQQISRWAAPMLESAPKNDSFRGHWLALPLRFCLTDHRPNDGPATIELRMGDESVVIEVSNGSVHIRPGSEAHADALITGSPRLMLALMKGEIPLASARSTGLKFAGDAEVLYRVQPKARMSPTRSRSDA
jgi:DNA-binding HxlR family transcriptional regulator